MYASNENSPLIWEINAENSESLENSFETLGYLLAGNESERKIFNEIQETKSFLQRKEKVIFFVKNKMKEYPNWLLIYDNVEKFADIKDYFPIDTNNWGQGKAIITTRNSNIQNNNYIHTTIHVEELNNNEKLELFSKILNNEESIVRSSYQTNEFQKFIDNIPPFPLDIVTAAYYLKATNIGYDKYLECINSEDQNFTGMQKTLLKESGGYMKTRHEIIVLTIQQLIKLHPEFEKLLLMLSLLNSQNIPYELLVKNTNEIIANNFISYLKKYSLVTIKTSSKEKNIEAISIHRSTQESIYNYFKTHLREQKFYNLLQSIVISIEKYMIKIIEAEDLRAMEQFVNHCQNILNHQGILSSWMKITLNSELGEMYHYLGHYQNSLLLLEDSFRKLDKLNDNCKLLKKARISFYLGEIYKSLGNYTNAIEYFEISIKIYKKYTPIHYKSLGQAISNLGNIYRTLGNNIKAKKLLEQALIIYKENLPTDYINISWILLFLGYVEENLGHYLEAKTFFEQSLIICQKYLPQNPVKSAWGLANIGNMDRVMGAYKEAKDNIIRSINICKEELSENHKGYMTAVVYLGETEINLGNYDKAKSLLEQALTIFKKSLVNDSFAIAWTKSKIGMLEIKQKNYDKAQILIEESILVYKKLHNNNENIVEIGNLLNILGEIHYFKGKLKEAEKIFEKSIKIMVENNHNDLYKPLENLATLYKDKINKAIEQSNNFEAHLLKKQAIKYFNQALVITKACFPDSSSHNIRILNKLNNVINKKI